MWWPFRYLFIYVLGGLTFVPLVIIGAICKQTPIPLVIAPADTG